MRGLLHHHFFLTSQWLCRWIAAAGCLKWLLSVFPRGMMATLRLISKSQTIHFGAAINGFVGDGIRG